VCVCVCVTHLSIVGHSPLERMVLAIHAPQKVHPSSHVRLIRWDKPSTRIQDPRMNLETAERGQEGLKSTAEPQTYLERLRRAAMGLRNSALTSISSVGSDVPRSLGRIHVKWGDSLGVQPNELPWRPLGLLGGAEVPNHMLPLLPMPQWHVMQKQPAYHVVAQLHT
jgi:hypothetical protein